MIGIIAQTGGAAVTPSYNVLMITGSASPNAEESEYISRLESNFNCTVTNYEDTAIEQDVSGYNFMIITGYADVASVGSKYSTAAINMMLMQPASMDELAIVGSNGTTRATQTAIYIQDNTDYLTSPFSVGNLTISSSERLGGNVNVGGFSADTVKLAAFESETISSSIVLAYVKSGDNMYLGTIAPALRMLVPFHNGGTASLTADGLTLFDRCINALIDPNLL